MNVHMPFPAARKAESLALAISQDLLQLRHVPLELIAELRPNCILRQAGHSDSFTQLHGQNLLVFFGQDPIGKQQPDLTSYAVYAAPDKKKLPSILNARV